MDAPTKRILIIGAVALLQRASIASFADLRRLYESRARARMRCRSSGRSPAFSWTASDGAEVSRARRCAGTVWCGYFFFSTCTGRVHSDGAECGAAHARRGAGSCPMRTCDRDQLRSRNVDTLGGAARSTARPSGCRPAARCDLVRGDYEDGAALRAGDTASRHREGERRSSARSRRGQGLCTAAASSSIDQKAGACVATTSGLELEETRAAPRARHAPARARPASRMGEKLEMLATGTRSSGSSIQRPAARRRDLQRSRDDLHRDAGWIAIRRGKQDVHKRWMITALVFSAMLPDLLSDLSLRAEGARRASRAKASPECST
jgi:hypothetical protein